jgi:hypothetical protein
LSRADIFDCELNRTCHEKVVHVCRSAHKLAQDIAQRLSSR